MKVFKNQSVLTDEIKKSMSIGETVILKLHDESPYVQFTVLKCISPEAFPYQGGFNSLKNAINYAKSIEQQNKISEMIFFGEYLMSDDRRESFASNPTLGDENLEERLKEVHKSDIDNWQIWRKQKVKNKVD